MERIIHSFGLHHLTSTNDDVYTSFFDYIVSAMEMIDITFDFQKLSHQIVQSGPWKDFLESM